MRDCQFGVLPVNYSDADQAAYVCINDDPPLTLTYFMTRSNLVAYVFDWEKLARNDLIDRIFMFIKTI